MNAAFHITRADLLERIRSSGFIIMLAVVAYLSYIFVPPSDAGYSAVAFDSYRLLYNSAGIGLMFGITASMFFSLFAFYLVKNTLARDRQSRVGQIYATTPTSKATYLLGKWGSNVALLSIMLAVMTLMAPLMQWMRGEATEISFVQLALPIWLLGLPMLSLVSGLAVLFESIAWLRGGLGNVAYFFLWSALLVIFAGGAMEATTPDPFGLSNSYGQLADQIVATEGSFNNSLNLLGNNTATDVIEWSGGSWSAVELLWRGLWFVAGGAIVLLGVLPFDRFDPSKVKRSQTGVIEERLQAWLAQRRPKLATGKGQLTPLADAVGRFRPNSLLLAELRLLLNGQPWYMYAALIGLFVVGLVVPGISAEFGLYTLIAPLLIWSVLGGREQMQHTASIIFTTPQPLRQLPFAWLAGVLVGLLASGGIILRLLTTGQVAAALGIAAAALFVPALAVFLGTISGTRRLFEIVYLLIWYVSINLGNDGALIKLTSADAAPIYLLLTVGLLAGSIAKRAAS